MTHNDNDTTRTLLPRLRHALDSGNLASLADLLDADVQWGAPDDDAPSCTNRDQVLAWYRRGHDAGVRASVTEITAHGDRVLIGLHVTGRDGAADRWQVVTVKAGLIVDIRAFDNRAEAVARLATA